MVDDKLVLDNIEQDLESRRASRGVRLANYLIDLAAFYAFIFVLGIALVLVSPSFAELVETDSAAFGLLDRLFTLLMYALFMGSMEALMKGKSIGKLITKTRAVNDDGSTISGKTAFARGFSRAVPFCAFSALGDPCDPWQDRWTDTLVVTE
jgi:uncharacterized RDD family membrane protein YckC